MSASETELTFIRCPSCRSLVPSVAVRCRMCGHQFEKAAGSGEFAPPPTAPTPPAPPVAPPTSNGSAKSVQSSPVSANSEEQDSRSGTRGSGLSWQIGSRVRQRTISATPEEMEELKREFTTTSSPRDPEPEPVQKLEAEFEEVVPPPPPPPPVASIAPASPTQRTVARDVHEETHEEEFDDNEFSEEEGDDSDSEHEQGDGRRRRRRRRKKKRTQFEGNVPIEPKPIHVEEPVRMMDQPREPQRVQPREVRDERRPTNFRGDRSFEPRPASAEPIAAPVAAPAAVREPAVGLENQLVGWLVNYDINPSGVSAELRSGKYFVSSKKLRPGDFVIEDDTVSTPHCMVTAVTGDGLYLQDLMSEKGTSVCRAGSSQWETLSGQQKLGNGDRIRFGAHEAMLVLVPKT